MTTADLDGPLADFYQRTAEIRSIITAVESAGKAPFALQTVRTGVDLTKIGVQTANTTNAMSLVFLASSFEEFIREEIGQCCDHIVGKYGTLPEETRHLIRGAYWSSILERFRFRQSILTKTKPRSLDLTTFTEVKLLVESAKGFVVDNDSAHIDRSVFYTHSNNFRPQVVDEIAARIGIKNLIDSACDNNKLRAHFGVTRKSEASPKIKAKMNDFYSRRNEIVHSLNSNTGYAVDVVFDYIEMFEALADGIKGSLAREIAKW